jgi:integrase
MARQKGSGTKLADGRWQVRATIGGRRQAFYGATLAEARRKAEDGRSAWQPTAAASLADFSAQWLRDKRSSTKPQTWARYDGIMRLHVVPALGSLPLSKVNEDDLGRFYGSLKLGDTSRHHVAVVLGTMLEDARRRRLIQANPARNVRAPRMRHKEKRPLTEAEARGLLETARGDRLEALYVLALTTGMRQGELIALRWANLDLEAGTVQVRGTAVTDYDGSRRIDTPKTGRSLRDIPIPPVAVQALAAHRARLGNPADGLVFPGRDGKLMAAQTVAREFYIMLAAAKLPRMSFHTLRDTAATLMLSRGISPHVVSVILGHASVNTTLAVYAHVTRGLEAQAAATVQAIFG